MAKFKLREIERVAKQVSRRADYPIQDRNELVAALGGRGAMVKYEDKEYKAEEADKTPDEIFPIQGENDFVNKMASLRGAGHDVDPDAEELPPGRKFDRPQRPG